MAAQCRPGDGERMLTEGGDSVLSVFSSEPLRAKL